MTMIAITTSNSSRENPLGIVTVIASGFIRAALYNAAIHHFRCPGNARVRPEFRVILFPRSTENSLPVWAGQFVRARHRWQFGRQSVRLPGGLPLRGEA